MFHRKLFGRYKNLELTGDKFEPLLMLPKSTEAGTEYYIDGAVRYH